jgi:hypothetical protein
VVAVKTLHKELVDRSSAAGRTLARWRNETAIGSVLAHPGIVAIRDLGETAALFYVAMEFVQGHHLSTYFDRATRFSEADAVCIAGQLLAALAHAHERGVCHGAISPASVFLTSRGEAKLADFGSVAAGGTNPALPADDSGGPGYIAPERYLGAEADGRADLFAVGALLFQLLTGRPAYAGSPEQIAYRVCRGTTPLPSLVDPRWERYDRVVGRALAKDPDARFGSAHEFRDALAEIDGPFCTTVSPAILISETARTDDVRQPTSAWATPVGTVGDLAFDGEGIAPADAVESGAPRAEGRWRLALVTTVVVVAVATMMALANWTGPEVLQRGARAERSPATVARGLPPTTGSPSSPGEPNLSGREPPTRPVATHSARDASTVERAGERMFRRGAAPASAEPEPSAPSSVVLTAVPTRPSAAPPPRTESPSSAARGAVATRAPQPSSPERTESPSGVAPEAVATRAPKPSPATEPAPAGPPPGFWRDQAIAFQVATQLSFNDQLRRSPVKVESTGGVVTLRGDMPSPKHVTEAIAVARAVDGVRSVRSELRVGAPAYVFPGSVSPP